MNVSNEIKAQYQSNSVHKNLILRFPEQNLQIRHEDLHQDSLRLKESVFDKDSIEFVGCIASIFQISIENLAEDVKGKKIEVELCTEDYLDSPIPLFHGIVDSAIKKANSKTKEIVAYDELYTKGSINVAAWYKALNFPITLKELRDSLFAYVGIEQAETVLPNDSVQIERQYNPASLQALAVMKAVCQINGAFGIINRVGRFEYRILSNRVTEITTLPYPSTTLFPSDNLFPGIKLSTAPYPSAALFPSDSFFPAQVVGENGEQTEKIQAESFSFYKSVSHEEYVVKPVDMVTIRDSEDADGIFYTESGNTGNNNYIIQGNMFTYGLSEEMLSDIAEKIYRNISGFEYMPFDSENNGLPYIECGLDAVSYVMIDYDRSTEDKIVYEQKSFYVLNRELTGIQALQDSYSAQGEEYQTEFVTDLQTQIDILKKEKAKGAQETQKQIEDYTYSRADIDNMFKAGFGGFDIVSVPVLPATVAANTVYLIQGEVAVN